MPTDRNAVPAARRRGSLAELASRRLSGPLQALLAGSGVSLLANALDLHAGGAGFSMAASVLVAGVGAVAFRLGADRLEAVAARPFASPEGARLLAEIRRGLDFGVTAARRDGAWLVYATPSSEPVAMCEEEYEGLRASFRHLNEIEASGDVVTVTRRRHGLPDSTHTAAPAVSAYAISTGRVLEERWFVAGYETGRDDAFEAYEAYRIENPAEPGARPLYDSKKIHKADEARAASRAERLARMARELGVAPDAEDAAAPAGMSR